MRNHNTLTFKKYSRELCKCKWMKSNQTKPVSKFLIEQLTSERWNTLAAILVSLSTYTICQRTCYNIHLYGIYRICNNPFWFHLLAHNQYLFTPSVSEIIMHLPSFILCNTRLPLRQALSWSYLIINGDNTVKPVRHYNFDIWTNSSYTMSSN